MSRALACALALCALAACEGRTLAPPSPTYDDVGPVLEAACAPCHGETRAEGGYRVDAYLAAIACPSGGGQAVEPEDASAAILAVLERADHADLLTATETALVRAWVEAGAPARLGEAHAGGWIDPRSDDFHGRALRAEHYRRMLDDTLPGSCARCHAGNGGASEPRHPAPGATACTSCHAEPEGPRACSTCHGAMGHAYPPRDLCFHPDEAERGGAHGAHARAQIACNVCHGERTVDAIGASEHGDGVVEVHLDAARAGDGAAFDAVTRTCATRCHDRGGATPSPTWQPNAGLTCSSCHQSPPADHYAGTCDACHREASPAGDALLPGPLHANGVVDLGDGSGGCGACHGAGDDPTPSSGSHAAHAHPALASTLECASCHVVPTDVHDAGHLDHTLGAEVSFGALASARGAMPTLAADGSCADVACHGSGLAGGTWTTPRWGDTSGLAARCGACHGVPPPAPHTSSTSCSAVRCHGGYVAPGPTLTTEGIAVHVNGTVDLWSP